MINFMPYNTIDLAYEPLSWDGRNIEKRLFSKKYTKVGEDIIIIITTI